MPNKHKDLTDDVRVRVAQIVKYSEKAKGDFAKFLGHSNQSRLSNWLKGDALPPVEEVLKIKRKYKISLDWVYDGDGAGQARNLTNILEAIEVSSEPAPRGRPQLRVVPSQKQETRRIKKGSGG